MASHVFGTPEATETEEATETVLKLCENLWEVPKIHGRPQKMNFTKTSITDTPWLEPNDALARVYII